jgi:hypothetical protein
VQFVLLERDVPLLPVMKANQKLTDDDVREIREKFAAGLATKKELAFDYNVSYPTITRVIRLLRRGKVV